MKHLKSFESMFKADEKEFMQIWEIFFCNDCNSTFEICQSNSRLCRYCKSKDIILKDKYNKIII